MFGIGMQELLIILVIGLLVFGSKKLPEIGGGLGRAIRNFRRAATEPDEIDITPKENKESTEGDSRKA
ncbi:MAG: twin-arginine translocase TatA/TatE family subunit [Desulfovibrio sp.]|nr:twin-arginine translocase TatA/TatE family subunit [Desulfovibrio sp.]